MIEGPKIFMRCYLNGFLAVESFVIRRLPGVEPSDFRIQEIDFRIRVPHINSVESRIVSNCSF